MKISKTNAAISAVIIVLMLCPIALLSSNNNSTANAQTTSPGYATTNMGYTLTTPNASSYGNPLQYEWVDSSGQSANGAAQLAYSAGPAPNSFDVLWRTQIGTGLSYSLNPNNTYPGAPVQGSVGATSIKSAFNGFVFTSNSSGTFALNYQTGAYVYTITGNSGTPIKMDNTYMLVGSSMCRIADGTVVWTNSTWNQWNGNTMGLMYDAANKLMYESGSMMWNFSNPANFPVLMWNQSKLISSAYITYRDYSPIGDGIVFEKQTGIQIIAFNETTGQVIWQVPEQETLIYGAVYYQGQFICGGLGGVIDSYDGKTGKLLWNYNPGGYFDFWAAAPAAAYGIYYEQNYDGAIYAINATNGHLIWKYQGPGNFYQSGPVVGDGKVYSELGTGNYQNPATGQSGAQEFVCLDAYTGAVIFKNDMSLGCPSFNMELAYGNLYFCIAQQNINGANFDIHAGLTLNEVWCISSIPKDWSMYGADPTHSFTGSGPNQLNQVWWFQTGGPVTASPTEVNGVVYVGSFDYNIYAINAYTGAMIWKAPTTYQVRSAVAVVNGKVYTGTDDGSIHCFNAADGTPLWTTPAGGVTWRVSTVFGATTRSSPVVVNGKYYCGALDGNLYCLDANTGALVWVKPTGGEIMGSPCVVNGVVYTNSQTPGPNGTLYALDANTGSVVWALGVPYARAGITNYNYGNIEWDSSPTYGGGNIYIQADAYFQYAINAVTGKYVWNASGYYETTPVPGFAPMIYFQGMPVDISLLAANATDSSGHKISNLNFNLQFPYAVWSKQAIIITSDMFFSCRVLNATDGTLLWQTYLNRELYGLAFSPPGQIYVVNEQKALFELDAASGAKISYFEPPVQSWSSPSLYDGRLYYGANDWVVRCFGEANTPAVFVPPGHV